MPQIQRLWFHNHTLSATELEWYLSAFQLVVYAQDQAIATARLLENNSIGRVAVLQQYRGEGIGKLLMQHIIQVAKQQNRAFLQLSAQVYATRFYENLGFQVQGEEYLDCEIPHIDMGLSLKNE